MARAKYPRQLSDYARLLHMSVSGINKLVARGKRSDPPELPPLDRLEQMADWYRRHYAHQPPPRFVELAEGPPSPDAAAPSASSTASSTGGAARGAKPPPASPPPPPAGEVRETIDLSGVASIDLVDSAELQRKKVRAEWMAYESLQRNSAATQQAIKTAGDRYEAAVNTLANIEAKVTAAEISRGERPHLADLREELAPIVATITARFVEALIDRAGLAPTQARAIADECFRDLLASRFAPAVAAAA